MEWDESLFALPSPALSGSGTVGIISALNYLGTPLRKCRSKVKKEFLNWQRFLRATFNYTTITIFDKIYVSGMRYFSNACRCCSVKRAGRVVTLLINKPFCQPVAHSSFFSL